MLFETTAVTSVPAPPFSRACELGEKQIAEDGPARFEAALDIRRAASGVSVTFGEIRFRDTVLDLGCRFLRYFRRVVNTRTAGEGTMSVPSRPVDARSCSVPGRLS